MNRKEGSDRPRSVTTKENTNLIEGLICSQEEAPHTHLAPRKMLNNSCFLQLKNLLSVMTGYLSKIVLRHIDRIWYKISLKKL